MKKTIVILCILIIAGCKPRPDIGSIKAAGLHFAGVFITENIQSGLSLRIKGAPDVKNEGDSIYHVTGMVEGYSSYNVPFQIDHFSETLHYSGDNPNDRKNWTCIEIYIGKNKIK